MKLVKLGSRGADVVKLQNLLLSNGYQIECDGDFGQKTLVAVKEYQQKHGIVSDGIVGEQTWSLLLSFPTDLNKTLKHADIVDASKKLGVPEYLVLAVTEVEAKKTGFDKNDNPRMLFERHIFYKQLVAIKGVEFADKISKQYPTICNKKSGGYLGGSAEYHRFQQALYIHETVALNSASYGLFQIMGFNYEYCGYESVQAFFTAMNQSEGEQLNAFVNFLMHKSNANMLKALKTENWAIFARLYNGVNYEQNDYDTKLQAAARRYKSKPTEAEAS